MKRLIVAVALVGAAAWAAVALATPSQGQTSTILATGALQSDVAFDTGLATSAGGITWEGKQYASDQLPEFLTRLRKEGITSLGEWLNLHPAVSAKFGMVPLGILHQPEVVTQQANFPPSSTSGWHTHPGYLTGTVVSGQVVRYASDCTTQTFNAGDTFYETGPHPFVVKNISNAPAVVMVTLVVPTGTPKTGLRIDQPQPSTCSQ